MTLNGAIIGCGIGFAAGWNVGNLGGVTSSLALAYGVSLATVGLLTTALFVTHTAVQIPGGRASDRFGPAATGAAAMGMICAGDMVAMVAPDAVLAGAARAVTGLGTGVAFVAGNALVRGARGSAFTQGVFGGLSLGAGGVALALVPVLWGPWDWRAPYLSSLVLAALLLAALVVGGAGTMARPAVTAGRRTAAGVLRDRCLYPYALLYSVSFGLSVTLGNWVVELLGRHTTLSHNAAAAAGSVTLLLGVVTRPLGGWLLSAYPGRCRALVAASLLAGALGTTLLLLATSAWAGVAGAALVGIGAGVPFAPVFTAVAGLRPDAPAAAVGLVNATANLLVLAATPLVGLGFALPGDGRAGFAAIAVLWVLGALTLPGRRGARAAGWIATEPSA